ncbi:MULTISPECIES: hypothetical protein [Staphylococcus]|uniref:hypothetical protein n=1 Tax=Staphylococcus TaxID=1279 RepID=UPI000D1B25E6|nr:MULTISPECIES: hypothetical protein [Staphylococcus]MBY7665300.1 hypothetical protein [Staphylococcus agnetis]MCO4326399.1 hypothetical protein [Staphylococcus agnetis]MCO4357234.1 hypothetical protein [Staphylococcus agnetis]MCO4362641.1 hypothetical protein [Staphylococcus agnetis]MCO4369166.1 hypothetical protein [Staphylococcus agnetis]
MKLYQMWLPLLIASTLINLISIKGFPLALGTLYLPILFKVVKMQMNLSNGLFEEDVNANVFIHNNQKGIVISVLCCIAVTVALFIYLKDLYTSLSGILGFFIMFSPITLALGLILYILTAVAIVQATKHKFTS